MEKLKIIILLATNLITSKTIITEALERSLFCDNSAQGEKEKISRRPRE